MNKFKLYIFAIFFLIRYEGISQELKIEFEWESPKVVYENENQLVKSIYFKQAEYLDNYSVPYFIYDIGVVSDDFVVSPQLIYAEYMPLSEEELAIFEASGVILQDEAHLEIKRKTIKKESYVSLIILPFRKNPQTGIVEKLLTASVRISSEWQDIEFTQKSKNSKVHSSVLENGVFYKLSISTPGVYRIRYDDLVEMGFNPDKINPANIRLYGNGGQMLPEKNDEARIDDLFENAIYVHGQESGKFGKNDYILFYAPGPHKWIYNASMQTYSRELNIYEDKSYYFLNIDKGKGKRIETINYMSEPVSLQTDIFLDRAHYENQTYNVVKSGKEWYGDVFDMQLLHQFDFSFPNAIPDSCVKVSVNMLARASGQTTANIQAGTANTTLSFQGTSSYTADFAKEASGTLCVTNASNPLSVFITYNKFSYSDAKAWLNNISISAWRKLVMTANHIHFQNPSIDANDGDLIKYNIQSSSQLNVWDITNPLEPKFVKGSHAGNTYSFNVEANTSKEFFATNGSSYQSIKLEGKIANQNLHGLPQVDYIIISHPMFFDEAEKLGEFHKQNDGLSYFVVNPQQIYNEFSSGSQDIAAIRDFIKMFYDRASDNSSLPKYVLIVGRASYDYKSRIQNNTNFVPTFQSIESLSPTKSYASDDFFGLLDDGEGYDCKGHLDIGIGRLPASTKEEAKNMVAKIIRYHEKVNLSGFQNTCEMINNVPSLSDWRNVVTFIADDGDNNLHFNQAEGLSNYIANTYEHINIDKIYLDAYPQISTSGGERAPTVNDAINKRLANGSLIVNYTGHGGEVGWAHERILELSDIQAWDNYYNMPLFITATCEFSRFDDPERIAAGELVLLNSKGGGVGLFSTTRLAFSNYNESLNRSVYNIIFEKNKGAYPTLGEVFAFSKTDNNSSLYIRNFILLGDPAMRLAYPQYSVITTEINETPAGSLMDTISALSFVTVKGQIIDELGNKANDFNGTISPIVFDKPSKNMTLAYSPSVNTPAPFYIQKNTLYKGNVEVKDGEFLFSFYVPKDINYAYGKGKISYYAENGNADATGYYNSFVIGGSSDKQVQDNERPSVSLFMNDASFVNGGITDENPVLIAELSDKMGINTTGIGIGHDIVAVLNDDYNNVYVLNQYYKSDLNSYNSGVVIFPFKTLSEGEHTLYFKAWNINNNSTDAYLKFIVSKSHNAIIQKMFNYPNPFFDYTEFVFEHNQSCTPLKITIDIYNLFGEHIAQVKSDNISLGYKVEPIKWDGRTSSGESLKSGTYIYTLRLTTCEGIEAQKTSKLVLIK